MSRMSELLVRQDLGSPGTRQLLESCLIFHHSNIPTSTSKQSLWACQWHWRHGNGNDCGPPVRLWSHGLTAAICLPLLKLAVFTYSLFPLLWILPLVFTAGWSHVFFYDHNQTFAASHCILISFRTPIFSVGFAVFSDYSTASTWVYDLRWWSDLSTYCDCVVNRGNGCSKALPTEIQSVYRGETSYSMRLLESSNKLKMSQLITHAKID